MGAKRGGYVLLYMEFNQFAGKIETAPKRYLLDLHRGGEQAPFGVLYLSIM